MTGVNESSGTIVESKMSYSSEDLSGSSGSSSPNLSPRRRVFSDEVEVKDDFGLGLLKLIDEDTPQVSSGDVSNVWGSSFDSPRGPAGKSGERKNRRWTVSGPFAIGNNVSVPGTGAEEFNFDFLPSLNEQPNLSQDGFSGTSSDSGSCDTPGTESDVFSEDRNRQIQEMKLEEERLKLQLQMVRERLGTSSGGSTPAVSPARRHSFVTVNPWQSEKPEVPPGLGAFTNSYKRNQGTRRHTVAIPSNSVDVEDGEQQPVSEESVGVQHLEQQQQPVVDQLHPQQQQMHPQEQQQQMLHHPPHPHMVPPHPMQYNPYFHPQQHQMPPPPSYQQMPPYHPHQMNPYYGHQTFPGEYPAAFHQPPAAPVQPQKQKTGPPGANLFVFNFPRVFSNQDLEAAFQEFGNVISATVFIDKATNRSKCFGFVSFDCSEDTQKAIQQMNGASLGGKVIKVQLKREGRQQK